MGSNRMELLVILAFLLTIILSKFKNNYVQQPISKGRNFLDYINICFVCNLHSSGFPGEK